ncbi:MAG: hypothetical protein QM538_03670 [Methylacidiphilales bacterium]|nr:hypothetical protein [Candidatus Methylacidiphilales bacterium]
MDISNSNDLTPLSVKDRTLTTKPSPEYPASDLSSALKTAKDFRLDIIKANKIIDEIKHSISQWKTIATQQFNIDRKECDEMQSAFLIH